MSHASTHPPARPPSTPLLRLAVVLVLLLAIASAAALVGAALPAVGRADPLGRRVEAFVPAAVVLAGGIAAAAVVGGLARVVRRPPAAAPIVVPSGPNPAAAELAAAVRELRSAVADLRQPPAPPAPPELTPGPAPVPEPEPAAVDPYLPHVERVILLLEEIRELTSIDDAARQARAQAARDRRRTSRLDEADLLVHRQSWEEADALLTLLESLHPGDPDVLARRVELDDARQAHRLAEWAQLTRQVEDHLALHRFDEAAAAVAVFRERFPAQDGDAAGLATMVAAEHETFVESGVSALFAEIKTAVDGHQWRMALDGAQRFLERFPDHPRADRIRQQVRTIQRNAESEDRHETEERIRELAKGHRFAEAAELCASVLERFPDSPQAPALAKLLPRLRERSALAAATVQ